MCNDTVTAGVLFQSQRTAITCRILLSIDVFIWLILLYMSTRIHPRSTPSTRLESSHPKVMSSNRWRSFGWWEMMLFLISGSLPSRSWPDRPDNHFDGLIVCHWLSKLCSADCETLWHEPVQALEIENYIKRRHFKERNMRIHHKCCDLVHGCAPIHVKRWQKTSVPSTLPTADICRVEAEIHWEPPVLAQKTDGWGPARRLETLGVRCQWLFHSIFKQMPFEIGRGAFHFVSMPGKCIKHKTGASSGGGTVFVGKFRLCVVHNRPSQRMLGHTQPKFF